MNVKTKSSLAAAMGMGLSCLIGCADSSTGSKAGQPIGYQDTPPKVEPGSPGVSPTNDPTNTFAPGGTTVPPPKRVTPDENSGGAARPY